jgi:hypothetical protein
MSEEEEVGKARKRKWEIKHKKGFFSPFCAIFIFLLLRKSPLLVLKDKDIVCAFFCIFKRFSNY